jgi:hypothetical protein
MMVSSQKMLMLRELPCRRKSAAPLALPALSDVLMREEAGTNTRSAPTGPQTICVFF